MSKRVVLLDGRRAFVVSNDAEMNRLCLAIVNERQRAGFYVQPDEPPPADYHSNTIRTLPESLKEIARSKLARHRETMATFQREKEEYDLGQRAITEKNGELAALFLNQRAHHEQESFDVIDAEPIP